MSFARWLRSLQRALQRERFVGGSSVKMPRMQKAFRRLMIEELEDRTLLSTITWTNLAGGSWQTNSNWDQGRQPAAGDDVVIPALNANSTVTYSSGTSTINSLTASAN